MEPDFTRFAATARTLTPMATGFRYPGGPLAPSVADADDAARLARDVVSFVRQRLGL